MDNVEGARVYDVSGRRERARQRRDNVVDTAAVVFGERGFESTTLALIAADADVSVAYLQGLGTKAEIFRLALNRRATGGAGTLSAEADDLIARAAALDAETSLEMVVQTTARWNAGTHRLWRAWAQSSDDELRAEWDASMVDVRGVYRAWIEHLESLGARRADISIEEQAAAVWLLTLAETYDRLVSVAGLTHEQYTVWLARSLRELVAAP